MPQYIEEETENVLPEENDQAISKHGSQQESSWLSSIGGMLVSLLFCFLFSFYFIFFLTCSLICLRDCACRISGQKILLVTI